MSSASPSSSLYFFWLLARSAYYYDRTRSLPDPIGFVWNPRSLRAIIGGLIFELYGFRVSQLFQSFTMSNPAQPHSVDESPSSDEDGLVFRHRRVANAPSTSGRPSSEPERIVDAFEPGLVEKGRRSTKARDVDVLYEAEKIRSTITTKRVSELIRDFQLPADLTFRIPGSDDVACYPREGEVAVFEAALLGGLRFPLPKLVREVLERLNLAVGQISPNSWRILIGCAVFWNASTSVNLTANEFLHCYKVSERGAGWWYFSARKPEFNFVTNLPSSHKGWKEKFFFVRGPNWEFQAWESDQDRAIRVPRVWGQPTKRGT